MRTQTLFLQWAVVALVVCTAFGAFAYDSDRRLVREHQQRALVVARTVAGEPAVREAAAHWSAANKRPGGGARGSGATLAGTEVRNRAEAVRRSTGSLFVVVTDDEGIRLAHPDTAELGRRVSTSPSAALSGREELARHRAHLGEEVVAKVPVRAPGSRQVVGEANVGVSASAVRGQLVRVLLGGLGWLVAALVVGFAASALLARRWKRLTLGLEPDQLAALVQEQEAVLHGIGEGVLALDARGVVTVANDEVRALLSSAAVPGRRVDALGLTARVRETIEKADGRPVMAVVGERVLVLSARPVEKDGRHLGALLTVADRTDVESLTRQLDAVQTMSSALRAQRHEFANRLHVLSGLVHAGSTREASEYLDALIGSGAFGESLPALDSIQDSSLRAFLFAKAASARERGVTLVLGGVTWVEDRVSAPVDVTTVVGNLLDNAIDAAHDGTRRPPRVEVELIAQEAELLVTVADSGDGVRAEVADDLFAEGVSTKDQAQVLGGRGVGLPLIRQIARARGGDVRLTERGSPPADGPRPPAEPVEADRVTGGAVFVARLPDVLDHTPEEDAVPGTACVAPRRPPSGRGTGRAAEPGGGAG
ncbi:sensor histidine kinase [Streptomyces sulphureus]|uniref:sensor histidine kinase n=1 Tax=Streptomyces sulphureus TaxID=47758 RepID=UPI000366740F|nr:sensor histidine kinase [Streptomyces sulphureus]